MKFIVEKKNTMKSKLFTIVHLNAIPRNWSEILRGKFN